ncbi:LysR family transcriptional regulator [Anaerobium acetethylicum]|uniref:DNA-binding transcriptional regulator, LysR family n=1 Tax=Anaerobium acetethylicum TaxID=1619234 RepID=A0A1D3TUF1_9FIRM|nr:LysR family transcriptional regulator [Anaerobium acetethylicum]SCP97659.1 DNA-binding transcriptional regulator, LysR family [Anaerobium acetethylicum]
MNKTVDYILEVAKYGGITKAANNLYITPSALSKFVQTKEAELNVKLFNRMGKKFVLTYAGERYVQMLEEMMELKMQMDIEMSRISSMYMGRMRIGFQMSLAHTVITHVITEFQEQFPNVQIMLEEGSSNDLLKMLQNNELDIIIATIDHPIEQFHCDILSEGEIVLAVPTDSPLTEGAIRKDKFKYPWIDLNEWHELKSIMFSEGQIFRKYSDLIFENYDIKPDVSVLVKTTKTALLCVANQMGVTFTSDILVKQNNHEQDITMLSFGETRFTHQLSLLSCKNNMFSHEINVLNSIFKNHL